MATEFLQSSGQCRHLERWTGRLTGVGEGVHNQFSHLAASSAAPKPPEIAEALGTVEDRGICSSFLPKVDSPACHSLAWAVGTRTACSISPTNLIHLACPSDDSDPTLYLYYSVWIKIE